MEVGLLSERVTFKPLYEPLQPAIRFFHLPLPASPTVCLAAHLPPKGRRVGLTEFHVDDTSGLGAACSPMAKTSTYSHNKREYPAMHQFG
ncbi:hypothetical protein AYR66_18260 [Noviherbaspirillum denitrificans]|uniref:Uncharacterized protein n=1 Tax=Noviherbaspirillum denitrificans TaxID=1968433 RepID=A0A254TEP3_9BURK|nr:hypothetical protein AYR66_18260 [Noviherbaspirillum denitrificans]